MKKSISLEAATDIVVTALKSGAKIEVVSVETVVRTISPLEKAIALQLKTGSAYGVGHKISNLANEVRKYLGDLLVTTAQIKAILSAWADAKLINIKNNYVKVVGQGNLILQNMARSAAAA